MTETGPINRALCGSGAFHVALLVGAFLAYDPVEVAFVHHEEGRRMVLATAKMMPPEVKPVEPERPVVQAPPPKKTRRVIAKKIEKTPDPVKPEVVQAPTRTPPSKKIQVAKRAGVQQIGAKSNAPKAKAAAATVADSRASGAAPSAPTQAAGERPEKSNSKRLIREYYGTLSSYLRRNYAYPRRAQLAAIEGTVLLEIIVDEDGNVIRYRVARSSGHEILDQAALASIADVRNVPPPPDGLAWSRRAIRVPFRYTLRT